MSWTTEPPTRNGYHLWRICYPGEPPTVEPFMVYGLPDGSQRVQELSASREGADLGGWELTEWRYRAAYNDEAYIRQSEYLFIGGLNTEWVLVWAFRELYYAAVSAYRDLMWAPDLSESGMAVAIDLAAAIDTIHKETK